MKVKFFNPGLAYQKHKAEYDKSIQSVLSRGDLILRKDLEVFENNFADFVNRKYAVGLNSGTDALYLSLKALGVGAGDEVVVSAHTFVASVQVVVLAGATPVLVDLGEDWRDKITPKTKAVIPCHIAGEVLDWIPVPGIHMIDDSCQGFGAKGFKGIIQCWSFYPAKILGSFGDAGGISTDSMELARDIKDMGNHWKSDYSRWGVNSRMDNLQAAVLNIKLANAVETLSRRAQIAMMYNSGIHAEIIPNRSPNRVWQDYIINTDRRDDLYEFLKRNGIETMKNEYPFPIPKPPRATAYEARTLRLPINEVVTDEEVYYVIQKINEYFAI